MQLGKRRIVQDDDTDVSSSFGSCIQPRRVGPLMVDDESDNEQPEVGRVVGDVCDEASEFGDSCDSCEDSFIASDDESEESDESEASEASEASEESEDSQTEDEILASELTNAQVEGASESGYNRAELLDAIATRTYRTVSSKPHNPVAAPIAVSSKLGVCYPKPMGLSGLYVVSIDQERIHNYRQHLLPLLLSATGTTVVAEVGDDGKFLSEPWLTGFKPFMRLNFTKGCYGSVGCFCRKKRLRKLYGVTHINSGVVFFVGDTCVANFNQDPCDEWYQEEHDVMPSYLRTVYKLGPDGVAKIHEHNVVSKGR